MKLGQTIESICVKIPGDFGDGGRWGAHGKDGTKMCKSFHYKKIY